MTALHNHGARHASGVCAQIALAWVASLVAALIIYFMVGLAVRLDSMPWGGRGGGTGRSHAWQCCDLTWRWFSMPLHKAWAASS
jgi:hypothetical protein